MWVGKIASRLNQRKKNARRRHSKQIKNDSGSNPIRIRFESDSNPVVVQPRHIHKNAEKEERKRRNEKENDTKYNAEVEGFDDALSYGVASYVLARFARIAREFHRKFTGSSPEFRQNIDLEHLKKGENHNSAFPQPALDPFLSHLTAGSGQSSRRTPPGRSA